MAERRPASGPRPEDAAMGPGLGPAGGRSFGPSAGRPMGGGARWLQPAAKARDAKGTMRRLWACFGVERGRLALIFVLVLLDCAALLAAPWLIGRCIDAMGGRDGGANPSVLGVALAALVAAWIIDTLIVIVQGWLMAGASQSIVRSLRKGLFGKLQRLPVSLFDRWSHGDLMSRLANDVDNISGTIAQSTTQLLSTVLGIAGSLALMLALSPLLTLAALVTVPSSSSSRGSISRKTRVLFREQQAVLGALNGHVEETMSGLDVVKAFGREAKATGDFLELNGKLRDVGTKAQIWSGFIMPLMNVINNIGFAAVAAVGGILAVRGLVTVGVIASFLSYSRQFTRPLNELANIWNSLQTAVAGAERVFELMDQAEEPADRPDAMAIGAAAPRGAPSSAASPALRGVPSLRGDVELDSVSFGYREDTMVLRDVSFSAPAGSVTALVGPTGAGKTTIVNLIARFYDVSSGQVRIDGRDVRDYARDGFRRGFGIVLQDSYLFSGSIRDNILYGDPGAGEAAMRKAAAMANAVHFIERMPRGYDSELQEGGWPLSEGQRQLVAIARAVLADPAILILDEATSSVDTRTELHIQEAMLSLMKGRTSFIIAHRLSTIRDADRILVLDGGRIVESGSHAELMASGGLYCRMYESQL